jgi:hypothetical protein
MSEGNSFGMRRFWTDEEIELLKATYPDQPSADIARALERDVQTIYHKAASLGLKKSDEYLASPAACRLRRGDNVGQNTRFSKGHTPFNKGVKGLTGNHPNTRKTQFTKGTVSPNWRPVGSERVTRDGYIEVKIAEGMFQWRLKHRVVWEQANGPIPKGHAVVFRDRDRTNCEIENLMLVTRRFLMNQNTLHNYPEPLKGLIHQMAGFNRKLNKRKREHGKEQNSRP